MMFFTIPTGQPEVREMMAAGTLGFIDTPHQSQPPPAGVRWCADNSRFAMTRWTEEKWWRWLQRRLPHVDTCLFATAPDVVGDAAATLELFRTWAPRIRDLGYPIAFVAQDGIEAIEIPWDEFEVLFIGGTDDFKFSKRSLEVVKEAKRRAKHVHFGRINSLRRWRIAEFYGADSADGTFLKFGMADNLRRLRHWHRDLDDRPAMFGLTEEDSA